MISISKIWIPPFSNFSKKQLVDNEIRFSVAPGINQKIGDEDKSKSTIFFIFLCNNWWLSQIIFSATMSHQIETISLTVTLSQNNILLCYVILFMLLTTSYFCDFFSGSSRSKSGKFKSSMPNIFPGHIKKYFSSSFKF